jgi:hypothetical protein
MDSGYEVARDFKFYILLRTTLCPLTSPKLLSHPKVIAANILKTRRGRTHRSTMKGETQKLEEGVKGVEPYNIFPDLI